MTCLLLSGRRIRLLAFVKSKYSPLWSYKQQRRDTFAKTNNLWNKQNHSTQVTDSIKELVGVYLVTKNETTWNSTYDYITFLLKYVKVNFSKCVKFCGSIGLVHSKKRRYSIYGRINDCHLNSGSYPQYYLEWKHIYILVFYCLLFLYCYQNLMISLQKKDWITYY